MPALGPVAVDKSGIKVWLLVFATFWTHKKAIYNNGSFVNTHVYNVPYNGCYSQGYNFRVIRG